MLETFKVSSKICDYIVEIEQGGVNKFIEKYTNHMIVDERVYKLWPSLKIKSPILVEALEKNKTLLKVSDLIEALIGQGATKNSTMISIGGGITQDVSTFCASSYMRGIKWIYIPTTLLGMVDSCIGGKSSINVNKFKNIAGNFFPPQSIFIDVEFCQTLSEQQLIEGLCEAIKICYAHSENRFYKYLSLANLQNNLYDLNFKEIISISLQAKKQFIEKDEFDNNIRLLLNFGHTFGHAIEGASNFAIPHGIAVGLGMISAYKLSLALGLVAVGNARVHKLLTHMSKLLEYVDGLALILNKLDMNIALHKFLSDKKHTKDCFVVILYDEYGSLIRKKIEQSEQNMLLVLEAFYFLKKFRDEI